MRKRRFLIGMITIGVVLGWVIGYYAGRMEAGITWWAVLVLLCVIFASAFTLRLMETRSLRPKNPKK